MDSKKKVRTKTGDVFQIPIDNNRVSFGQVVEKRHGVLRVITFNQIFSITDDPTIDEILIGPIVFLTETMDAKIYHGDWKIIGNTSVPPLLPNPRFKSGLETFYVTDYYGNPQRIATKDEADKLDYKFSVSAMRVQNAMQAYFGIKEWDKDFDKLTYRYCLEKSKIGL